MVFPNLNHPLMFLLKSKRLNLTTNLRRGRKNDICKFLINPNNPFLYSNSRSISLNNLGSLFRTKKERDLKSNEDVEVLENKSGKMQVIKGSDADPIETNNARKDESKLTQLYKKYQNFTWYFHPTDRYESLDLLTEVALKENVVLKEPIIYKVISLDNSFQTGINLTKCLIDSPFDSNSKGMYNNINQILNEKQNNLQGIHFRSKKHQESILSKHSPLKCIQNSKDKTIIIDDPILKYEVSSSKLDKEIPIELWITKGYEQILRIDRMGDISIIIIHDLTSALKLSEYIKIHSVTSNCLKGNLKILIDQCEENLIITIKELFKHNHPTLNIEFYSVDISMGNEAYNLILDSPNNATQYQHKWLKSNLSVLKEELFSNIDFNKIKQRAHNIRKKQFLLLSDINIAFRIQHSELVLERCQQTLNDMEALKEELIKEVKEIKVLSEPHRSSNIIELIEQQIISIYPINNIKNFPLSYFKVLSKINTSFYYHIESELTRIQGWQSAKLQEFWDKKSIELKEVALDRPTIDLNYINLRLLPSKISDIKSIFKKLINWNSLIDEVSKKQEDLLTRLLITQLLCITVSQLVIGWLEYPLLDPIIVIPSALSISILSLIKFIREWNNYGKELIERLQVINNKIEEDIALIHQQKLIEKVELPIKELVNKQIVPYHQQLLNNLFQFKNEIKWYMNTNK